MTFLLGSLSLLQDACKSFQDIQALLDICEGLPLRMIFLKRIKTTIFGSWAGIQARETVRARTRYFRDWAWRSLIDMMYFPRLLGTDHMVMATLGSFKRFNTHRFNELSTIASPSASALWFLMPGEHDLPAKDQACNLGSGIRYTAPGTVSYWVRMFDVFCNFTRSMARRLHRTQRYSQS